MENLELDIFWKNKKVLITGHTGFKGSWLTIWLENLGATVIGYSIDTPTTPSLFKQCKLDEKIVNIQGDILDEKLLKNVFNEYEPDVVFHLAAQPLIKLSYEKPKNTYEVNVIGTFNVLNCIKNTQSVKASIIVTTDKCYENKEQIWPYREDDVLGGYDMYSSSKACCEIMTKSFVQSFNLNNIATVRAGNVIGGGDFAADRIIPDFMRAIEKNEPLRLRNPESIRPWQHVLEPLGGYIMLAEKLYNNPLKYKGAWNFGASFYKDYSVLNVCNELKKHFRNINIIDESNSEKVHEANILKLDSTKAKTHLNWYSKLNFEETIKRTAFIYENFYSEKLYELICEEIANYVDKKYI